MKKSVTVLAGVLIILCGPVAHASNDYPSLIPSPDQLLCQRTGYIFTARIDHASNAGCLIETTHYGTGITRTYSAESHPALNIHVNNILAHDPDLQPLSDQDLHVRTVFMNSFSARATDEKKNGDWNAYGYLLADHPTETCMSDDELTSEFAHKIYIFSIEFPPFPSAQIIAAKVYSTSRKDWILETIGRYASTRGGVCSSLKTN